MSCTPHARTTPPHHEVVGAVLQQVFVVLDLVLGDIASNARGPPQLVRERVLEHDALVLARRKPKRLQIETGGKTQLVALSRPLQSRTTFCAVDGSWSHSRFWRMYDSTSDAVAIWFFNLKIFDFITLLNAPYKINDATIAFEPAMHQIKFCRCFFPAKKNGQRGRRRAAASSPPA
jgi:hypothetical protein